MKLSEIRTTIWYIWDLSQIGLTGMEKLRQSSGQKIDSLRFMFPDLDRFISREKTIVQDG